MNPTPETGVLSPIPTGGRGPGGQIGREVGTRPEPPRALRRWTCWVTDSPAMKFGDLAIGALFRFSTQGLPPPRATESLVLGPYRKVTPDEAVLVGDERGLRMFVSPSTNVVGVEE